MKPKFYLFLFSFVCLFQELNAQTLPDYLPTNALVGWWPFSGNTNNAASNVINGLNFGAVLSTDRFGNNNGAYSFNGTNSRIELPVQFNENQRTVNFWFYPEASQNSNEAIFGNDHQGLSFGMTIVSYNPTINQVTTSAGGAISSVFTSANAWSMFTISRDADSTRFYLNSNLISTLVNGNSSSAVSVTQNITLGCTRLIDRHFTGKIDDVGLWGRSLTKNEIDVLFGGCPVTVTGQSGDVNVSAGGSAKFSVDTDVNSATFQWQTDLGLGFQNLSNAGQYSGVNSDTLKVSNVSMNNNNQKFRCLVITDPCTSESDTAKLFVQVSNKPLQSVNQIVVYPNPGNEKIWMKGIGSKATRFTIYNQWGKVVKITQLNSEHDALYLRDLKPGLYFIKFASAGLPVLTFEKL